MKVISIVLISAFAVFSQVSPAYNVKTFSFSIQSFSNDSLKATPWFPAGDGEGVDFVVKSAAKDSSVFTVAYQRGYWDGGAIIAKRPSAIMDTFNTLVAGNFNAAGTAVYNAFGDTDVVQAIDSSQVSGFVVMAKHFYPFRSPYARLVLKGLTGNKKTAYGLFVTVSQPKYMRVDVGTGKQPE